MIGVERVDFVSIPTQDLERAKKFYGEALGLPRDPRVPDPYAGFEIYAD